jgi:hypothetical protein
MKKVIILGSVSYILDHAKVGINWIGEYLADNGYQVTYVSSASTVLDAFSKVRRKRFVLAWLKGGRQQVSENLVEVVFKSPWILNRVNSKIIHKFCGVFERKLISQRYDLLISTVGSLVLLTDKINAKKKFLRLQDSPYDFGISHYNIMYFEHLMRNNAFSQIWSVSKYLMNYSTQISSSDNYYLPNGVNLKGFMVKSANCNLKKAIYFGAFTNWVDLELIYLTARYLPDWQIDLYGPNLNYNGHIENVKYFGSVSNESIPKLLENYSVGLIPFANCKHVESVERPLKFYQYLAANLGVASVSYGDLKQGMGSWACYGNNPQEFAQAILDAFEERKNYDQDQLRGYLEESSWGNILPKFKLLVEK